MNVIGVDFSGAKTDNRTWIAECLLDGLELTIKSCHSISRYELANVGIEQNGTVKLMERIG